jgi:hypothetical protein
MAETHPSEKVGDELATVIGNDGGGYTKMLEEVSAQCLHSELSSGISQRQKPTELRESVHTNKQEFVSGLATWERPNVVYEQLLERSLRHL